MRNFLTKTRLMKLLGIGFFVAFNILFYTLEAPGMGTGFDSAWEISPFFGIFLSLVIGVPLLGWIYFFIMDV